MARTLKGVSKLDPSMADNANDDCSVASSQSQPRDTSEISSNGDSSSNVAGKRNWRPEQGTERDDPPVYTRLYQRSSSLSIDKKSKNKQVRTALRQQLDRASNVSSSSLDRTVLTDGSVHSPPSGSQPVRMESLEDCGSQAGSGSHASRPNELFAFSSSAYDDKENGPRSCPSAFGDGHVNRRTFSFSKKRPSRCGELIVSKLQPTCDSVNNMLTYLHELQQSEASLRKQLLNTKRHTEEELNQSLSKLNELQRTMKKVERDRKRSLRKVEEKEQRICELAAKLKKAESTKQRTRPGRSHIFSMDGLPRIAEEAASHIEAESWSTDQHILSEEVQRLKPSSEAPPALTVEALLSQSQPSQPVESTLQSTQLQKTKDESTQHARASPPSPTRPLWDPWASGSSITMNNLPPVFMMGPTGLNAEMASDVGFVDVKDEHYELKSVLLSPRQAKNVRQTYEEEQQHQLKHAFPVSPSNPHEGLSRTLSPGPVISDSPSPLSSAHQHQQDVSSSKRQGAACDQMPEHSAITGLSSEPDAMFRVGATSPIQKNVSDEYATELADTECHMGNGFRDQQDVQMRATRIATDNDDPSQTSVIGHNAGSLLKLPVQTLTSIPDEPVGCASQPFPISNTQPDCFVSSIRSTTEKVHSELVSLETLLVEFFTEVDNKRLKMAKVYGKRYAGREKWLFAELTKRYGAAKVATLKARYEKGSGGEAFSVSNHDMSMNDHHATSLSDVSSHTKAGRQGHSRHPQFLHPATPGNNVAYSASAGVSAVSSPVASLQAESCSQARQVAEETDTSSGHSGRTPADPVLSQPRQSGGNILPLTGVPPSFSNLPETGEKGDRVTAVGTGGPSSTSTPIETTRHGEPNGQVNQLPFCSQTGTEDSNSAGLRQRHQSSRHSEPRTGIERPAVTLESLLKELYKNHQPDKLKNVSIVAKQYAGRERELVRLLKGKYGAFSVKRFEENLDVLERAHRARIGNRGVGKKRGCWARTISLMFWLSLLLYFSFGAVLVSIVLLDAWECRSFDSEKQELEVADDCRPLKKELETFTYERIAAYVSQSHSDACFCLEWKARESAVFGTFAGADLVKLVMLVPFSPASFGASWMATVKEYIPPQESYDSYAKPVVDLLLDAGSFMWFSVVELTGYDEILEKSSVATNVIANNSNEVPSVDEDGASDALVGLHPQAAEMEDERITGNLDDDIAVTKEAHVVENEGVVAAFGAVEQVPVEEEVVSFDEKLNLGDAVNDDRVSDVTDNVLVESENVISDVSKDMTTANKEDSSLLSKVEITKHTMVESTTMLELEDVAPVEATESMAESMAESIDGSEQELSHEVEAESTWTEDDSVSTLTEEVEPVGGMDDGTSAFTETEEEDVVAEEKAFFNDVEKETAAEVSDDVSLEYAVAEDVAVESESVVEAEVREEGFDLSYPEVELDDALNAEFAEMSVDNESEPLFGSGEEPFASNEDAGVAGTEDVSDGVFVSLLNLEEAVAASAEIDAAGEVLNLPSEIEVENFEEVANEIDDVGDTNAESTTWNEFEEKQSMSRFDLVNEQGEGFVANEATISSDGEGTVSAEHAEEANEHVEDAGNTGCGISEDRGDVAAGKNEISVDDTLRADTFANILMDRANEATDLTDDEGPRECVADADDTEEEEILFMQTLDNAEELLWLAERAAAATMETR